MARELVLVPKEEYESLLSSSRNSALCDGAENVSNRADDIGSDTKETVQPKAKIQSKEGENRMTTNKAGERKNKQKGKGRKRRRYVQQSIDNFFRNAGARQINEKKKTDSVAKRPIFVNNKLAKQWLSYKLK